MTEEKLPRVVIVGGGFGGLMAAKGLRKAPVEIMVLDRSNHHLFQPLLYQVATAGLSPADIASPIRSILHKQKNTTVFMGEVIGIDTASKGVILRDRAIPYDFLVLATGARHSYFGRDEWEHLAPGLKSIEDATLIRRKILLAFEAAEMESDPQRRRELLTFVIIGGGPTGVEMAGSIAELAHKALSTDFRFINTKSARIVLVEGSSRILRGFCDSLSANAMKSLEKLGVEVRTGTVVQSIDREGVVLGEEALKTRTVIWAAGVIASPVGRWLGAECDAVGRVKVNPDLTAPSHEDIFVIGDTALVHGADGNPLPGIAPVAMQQGSYVASLIKARLQGMSEARPFQYVEKGKMATIGRSSAIVDFKGFRLTGFIAWLAWLLVHIYYIIGFRNRLLVLIQWAWAYFTFQRGTRLITLDVKSKEENGGMKAE
jgi:NADH dehydrogenase